VIIGKTVRQIKVGATAETTKTISESDVYLYAGITGDLNPAHVNSEYASGTFFGRRIAHGLLSAGLISAVFANKLPGPGSVYLSQSLKFLAPVYIGDTITARVEAVDVNVDKNRVRFRSTCTNQDGTTVIDGEAVISPAKPKSRRRRRQE
jgi:3-hydroxybutyryl-CoA dehydratase